MDLDNHFPCSNFLLLNQKKFQRIFSGFSWCYIVKFYASFFKDVISLQETILEWILTLCIMSAEWMYCKIRWENLCNSPSSHLLISSLENTALAQPTQFRCSSLAVCLWVSPGGCSTLPLLRNTQECCHTSGATQVNKTEEMENSLPEQSRGHHSSSFLGTHKNDRKPYWCRAPERQKWNYNNKALFCNILGKL